MALSKKDLLGLRNISRDEINEILDTAELMKYILIKTTKKHLIFRENPL